MPHSAADAHVHLARHPERPDAVTATITGSGTYTTRALLAVHGFRQVGPQTMILARIDQEEPHYADQAARAMREQGTTVDIDPSLQENIDTEWTWANYPMRWLNRNEIREVSAQAQTLHDDIVSGRLVIHLHAHDGHTTVAVGTYRGGKSVHLHGENHLRQETARYDTPGEALAEFERLYGNAVRPGPAPATDTELRAGKALAAAITGVPPIAPPDTSPEPARPRTETVPVYAADPGDHEALLYRPQRRAGRVGSRGHESVPDPAGQGGGFTPCRRPTAGLGQTGLGTPGRRLGEDRLADPVAAARAVAVTAARASTRRPVAVSR